jgi:hypothetical protein
VGGSGRSRKRRPVAQPEAYRIHEIRMTKEETTAFVLSQEAIDSWPDVQAVDISQAAPERISPDPGGNPKASFPFTCIANEADKAGSSPIRRNCGPSLLGMGRDLLVRSRSYFRTAMIQ